MNILVIAAHPDDEVLGMGATIKKLSKRKNKVHLCVISEGTTAQYNDTKYIKIRREACIKAGKILGINEFNFLNFPDMKLESIPHLEINRKIEKIIVAKIWPLAMAAKGFTNKLSKKFSRNSGMVKDWILNVAMASLNMEISKPTPGLKTFTTMSPRKTASIVVEK